MYSLWSKCYWRRYNTTWKFLGEPISDHPIQTAAMKSAENLRQQVIWSLLYTYTACYEQDSVNYSSISKFSVLQNAWELSKK
jgi:hypothetical protein